MHGLPTKRMFDMTLMVVVLATLALKLAKAAAPHWQATGGTGLKAALGKAAQA